MICAADTIGVFQIESRAQMTMLPRLRPRCFYDLVIEVAIVRPGPIQGDMVHPYLRRRNGEEPVTFPSEDVRDVLGKTLGIPLFQEQAMALAIVAAGFTPGEADELRRSMAAWRRRGNKMAEFGRRFKGGMIERGYPADFAERCFKQIQGFSEYGFPESHAASFAHLVYVSCWLKKHHPAAFAAALINSQPMGFYAPAQIVRDARDHGVEVREVDVNRSGWDCTLEEGDGDEGTKGRRDEGREHAPPSLPSSPSPAIRLGLRLVKGLKEDDANAIAGAVRTHGSFDSIEALWRRSGVAAPVMRRLAGADAFRSMGIDRQAALWHTRTLKDEVLPLFEHLEPPRSQPEPGLPEVPATKQVFHDYGATGLSLKAHPLSFIRETLEHAGVVRNDALADESAWRNGRPVSVAGLVLVRQRPSTAKGVIFVTLEDEYGIANLILHPRIYERYRQAARLAVALLARGRVERQGEVVHVMVDHLESIDDLVASVRSKSRDFH